LEGAPLAASAPAAVAAQGGA